MKTLLAIAILSPLMFATNAPSPFQPSWVDPNAVQGKLLTSVDDRAGLGVVVWGDVFDPNGDPLVTTIEAPPGAKTTIDNVSNTWAIEWFPALTERGVKYIYLRTTENPDPNTGHGKILTATATVAIRVLPPNLPPVIRLGGCRIIEK